MKLTDTQRRQILRGNYPHLALEPDEAKALEPHRITIKQQVWIDVLGAKRDKKKGWYADYKVRDDRPRFMRRGAGGGRDAYTHSIALAVVGEDAEAVPAEYQNELTVRAHRKQDEFDRDNRPQEVAAQQARQLERRLRRVATEAARMGVDLTPHLVGMLRQAEALMAEERQRLKDAA